MLSALLGQLVCIGAVWVACDRSLKTYIAISSLNKDTSASAVESTTQEDDQAVVPGTRSPLWRRALSKQAFKQYLAILIVFAIEGFVVFGLPRLTTRFFQDLFWGGLMLALISSSFYASIHLIFRPAILIRVEQIPKTKLSKVHREPLHDQPGWFFLRPRIRLPVSIALAIGVLSSAYHGYMSVLPIVAAAYVMHIVSGLNFPRTSIKKIFIAALSILLLSASVGCLAASIETHFFNKNDTPDEEKSDGPVFFSPWLGKVMNLFSLAFAFISPATVIALSLRFEHSISDVSASHPLPKDGHAIVPVTLPPFPAPIFKTGIVSLILAIVGFYGVTLVYPPPDVATVNSAAIIVTLPVAFAAMAAAAWWTGQFKAWFSYSEDWFPKPAETSQKSDDVEKAEEEQVVDDLLDAKA